MDMRSCTCRWISAVLLAGLSNGTCPAANRSGVVAYAGRVVDASGKPVSGARVCLYRAVYDGLGIDTADLSDEIVDESGNPVAAAVVSPALATLRRSRESRGEDTWLLPNSVASQLLSVKTGTSGRFVLRDLPGDAACELLVSRSGYATLGTAETALIADPCEVQRRCTVIKEARDRQRTLVRTLHFNVEQRLDPPPGGRDWGRIIDYTQSDDGRYRIEVREHRMDPNISRGAPQVTTKTESWDGYLYRTLTQEPDETPSGMISPAPPCDRSVREVMLRFVRWFLDHTTGEALGKILADPRDLAITEAEGRWVLEWSETSRFKAELDPARGFVLTRFVSTHPDGRVSDLRCT